MKPAKTQVLSDYLPFGLVTTKQWLLTQGIAVYTIDNALKSKTLVALANGVYARSGVSVTWQGIASSLQKMTTAPYHVGGLTALEHQGLGHYASLSEQQTVQLYSPIDLPGWMKRLKHKARFKWHGTKRLWTAEIIESSEFVKPYRWHEELPEIQMSCAEKACLEMLSCVPKSVSFEHAGLLLQGMTNLSPGRLEALLRGCSSIKVKRLFFWLGEKYNYAWMHKLKSENFNLGAGKRVIAKGGVLDKTYLITVPKHLHGSE